jgi:hypothetical protein
MDMKAKSDFDTHTCTAMRVLLQQRLPLLRPALDCGSVQCHSWALPRR